MQMQGKAVRIKVYIGESDTWEGKPLASAIVRLCKEQGLAGATVTRGIEGFGAHSKIHTAHIVDLSTDLPLVVEIIDTKERIQKVLPTIQSIVKEGLITLEETEVIMYAASKP